jgi:hypothetical protein
MEEACLLYGEPVGTKAYCRKCELKLSKSFAEQREERRIRLELKVGRQMPPVPRPGCKLEAEAGCGLALASLSDATLQAGLLTAGC